MLKKLKGYEAAKVLREQEALPPGGYVVKVLNVKTVEYDWGAQLLIQFDIEEGEQKGYYQNNFDLQQQEDRRWKGVYRLRIPKDDGSEQDEWAMIKFKTVMNAFEESNQGYHFDWDETKLTGKIVGAVFNRKEWKMETAGGYRTGFFTNCHSLRPAEMIRAGKFKIPADTLLKEGERQNEFAAPAGFEETCGDDDELPF